MNSRRPNVAIAFNTRLDDPKRIESVKRVLPQLVQPHACDLWWFDGSTTDAGIAYVTEAAKSLGHGVKRAYVNVLGGPDRAFFFAVSTLLNAKRSPGYLDYDYIGVVEDDVLLEPDWFERTMELFTLGERDNLRVGAVSARAYEDRCFIQTPKYAVMHNLGWGQIILSRAAAWHTLQNYRTGWTLENRRTFATLSGRDMGPFWCWKGMEQWVCSDWGNDAMLASRGYASLALTPSACEMINQNPPLEQQGLRIVKRQVSQLVDDRVFRIFVNRMQKVRNEDLRLHTRPQFFRMDNGHTLYFTHQLHALGALYVGGWRHELSFGFGPFARRAAQNAMLTLDALGPVEFLVGGGEDGGSCRFRDLSSGYEIEAPLEPRAPGKPYFVNIIMPTSVNYRTLVMDNITPGVVLYGLKTNEPQPDNPSWRLAFDQLAPVEGPASTKTGDVQGAGEHGQDGDENVEDHDPHHHDQKKYIDDLFEPVVHGDQPQDELDRPQ